MSFFAKEYDFGFTSIILVETTAVPAMRNKLKMISPVRLNRKEFTGSGSLPFFNFAISVRKMSINPNFQIK
jgi:hypothetical protein